jgi:cytochrome c553
MLILSVLMITTMLVSACSSSQPTPTATEEHVEEGEAEHTEDEAEHTEDEAEHAEDEHPPDEHEEGGHEVPHEAAEVPNPIDASDESVATGGELYATHCGLCHGETGEGDGPAAAGLAVPPADLHEDHVQGLSDGALFYIISHSEPESPMPAWEDVLDEDQRWNVVNFLRTFAGE